MSKASKRLFDIGLIAVGFVLAVATTNIGMFPNAASRVFAMSLITWLLCSLPLAVLIGHCALSED
jgi:hypothetical protein